MNEIIQNMITRRSIKKYKPDPVPREMLDQILKAGTYAACGMGRQSPIIIAVTDKTVRDELSALNAKIMGASGDPFYGAPAVLIVLADKSIPTHVYDGSLVMGNLMNAAHALGLGSCWIQGRLREAPDGRSPEDSVQSALHVPTHYRLEAILSLGMPETHPAPHRIEELPVDQVHWEVF